MVLKWAWVWLQNMSKLDCWTATKIWNKKKIKLKIVDTYTDIFILLNCRKAIKLSPFCFVVEIIQLFNFHYFFL